MIALYRGRSPFSRLIRLVNWSDYSHAAWIAPSGKVYEAWHKGVVCAPHLGANHIPGTLVDLYTVQAEFGVDQLVEAFLRAHVGNRYDWAGVLHFVTRRPERTSGQDRWFCSELVFASYARAGIDLLARIPAWKVYPAMLAYSPLLIYTGTVQTTATGTEETISAPDSDARMEGSDDSSQGTRPVRTEDGAGYPMPEGKHRLQ